LIAGVSLAVLRFVNTFDVHTFTAKVGDASGKAKATVILERV
jgi:hypothetical protein